MDEFWEKQGKRFSKSAVNHLLIFRGIAKADLVDKIISQKIDGYSKNYRTLCLLGFMHDKGFDMHKEFAPNGPEPLWDKEFLLKQDDSILRNLFLSFESLMEEEEDKVLQNDLTKGKVIFRYHRGELSESMETAFEVESIEQLKSIITEDSIRMHFPAPAALRIEHYGFDKRINWNSHIVTLIDKEGKEYPIGFTNGELITVAEQ